MSDDRGPVYIPGPNAHGAMANELQRAVAEPAGSTDGQHSTDLTLRNVQPIVDLMPYPGLNLVAGSTNPLTGIFSLPESIAGVALSGFLAPGDMALIGPQAIVSALYQRLVAEAGDSFFPLENWLLSNIGSISYSSGAAANTAQTFPSDCVLLRAGEAVNFGRVLGDSLYGIFLNTGPRRGNRDPYNSLPGNVNGGGMWPVTYPFSVPPPGVPSPVTAGPNAGQFPLYVNNASVVGPTSRPIMRVFKEPQSVPRSVQYTKIPWVDYVQMNHVNNLPNSQSSIYFPTDILANFNTAHAGIDGCFVLLPPGLGWATLSLNQQVGGIAPSTFNTFQSLNQGGVAAFDMNVYWLLSDGVWHQNPADQWTATSRGQASGTHDVEVYEIPSNALGVGITAPSVSSASNLYFWVMATEE